MSPVSKKNSAVLFIVGPTASGKSALALALAKKLDGEIISADSMQIYRGMDIGTAKPTLAERRRVTHHLIDIVAPSRSFSVFDYRKKALAAIRRVRRAGKVPIVVGGTGLYVKALLEGLSNLPGENMKLRAEYKNIVTLRGLDALVRRLKQKDPAQARRIDLRNPRRVIRALEIAEMSGGTFQELDREKKSLKALGFYPIVLGVTKSRELLYGDINRRVDLMFRRGLVREVQALGAASDRSRVRLGRTARQGVGYKEILDYLAGSHDLACARELVKQNSRRLAKRQMTWFRKHPPEIWIDQNSKTPLSEAVTETLTWLKARPDPTL